MFFYQLRNIVFVKRLSIPLMAMKWKLISHLILIPPPPLQMTGRYEMYAEELAKVVGPDFKPNIIKETEWEGTLQKTTSHWSFPY